MRDHQPSEQKHSWGVPLATAVTPFYGSGTFGSINDAACHHLEKSPSRGLRDVLYPPPEVVDLLGDEALDVGAVPLFNNERFAVFIKRPTYIYLLSTGDQYVQVGAVCAKTQYCCQKLFSFVAFIQSV